MNRKNIILSLAALIIISGFNVSYAADNTADNAKIPGNVTKEAQFPPCDEPPVGDMQGPPPGDFQGPPPPSFEGKGHHNFQDKRPTKEEMDAKKAEFDKRLKLTDKQKKQIELQKTQDREKIKPVLDDIRAKKQEFGQIQKDTALSQAEKDKKLKAVKDDLRELKIKADSLRKENMQNFENILTDKQKKEFTKIKEEQRKEMEQRKKSFEKHKMPPRPMPAKEE